MPVKKISDAPANIKELDDTPLTLAQINYILSVYDAVKAQGKVKSPMAVAIAKFKKEYHVSDGKWVKNKKKAEGASMADLENLERYVVIQTGDQAPGDVGDLRELEGDFGYGIYPLWSDSAQSIIAFAFEPTLFDEEEARDWVKQAMKGSTEMSLVDIVQAVVSPIAQALSAVMPRKPGNARGVALRSFDELRRLVNQALEDRYSVAVPGDEEGAKRVPWILDMGPRVAIVELEGRRYAVTYQVDENDAVMLGELTPVDQEWVRKSDGAPIMLHAFAIHLGAGDEAEDDADRDDGLIWKELIHPGKWFKSDSGRIVEMTAEMLKEVFQAWKAGLPKFISVPSDNHHARTEGLVPVENNRGFVEKLKMVGDQLFGGFKFTDPDIGYGVQVGNIADVSVYLQPNVIHPETGENFPWVLQHVLLTNDPLVQDLSPFGAVPASAASSGDEYVVQSYQQNEEVTEMPEKKDSRQDQPQGVTLSAEESTVYEEFRGLNLSVADVQAMIAERKQVRQKARDLEITRIVRALEGVETHDAVVQVEDTRHYPVVCVAVEKALREQPEVLALAANEEGQTGLDGVILEIVNAIPQEGRLALSTDGQPSGDRDPKSGDRTLREDAEPTDEQIDELGTRIS